MEHLRKARQVFKLRLEVAELTLQPDDPKFDFLRESIAISEQQLYLASAASRDMILVQHRVSRDPAPAGAD